MLIVPIMNTNLVKKVSEVAMLMVQDGTVSNLANCIKDVIFIGKTDDYTLKKII